MSLSSGASAMRPLVIGIAGGTGSGKTTVAKRIAESLPADRAVVIQHDWYYLDRSHLTDASARARQLRRARRARQRPAALGPARRSRRDGRRSALSTTSRRTRASSRVGTIAPHPIVIVEGILLFAIPSTSRRVRSAALRRHRRRHPPASPHPPGHRGARPRHRVDRSAVPGQCPADAPAPRGAEPPARAPHHPRGRRERARPRRDRRPTASPPGFLSSQALPIAMARERLGQPEPFRRRETSLCALDGLSYASHIDRQPVVVER